MKDFSATLRHLLTRSRVDEPPEAPLWSGGHVEALCSVYPCGGEKLCQVAVSFPPAKPWLHRPVMMYTMTWQEFQDMLPPVEESPLWQDSLP